MENNRMEDNEPASLIDSTRECFFCGTPLEANESKCPKCAAINILPAELKQIIEDPRNPNLIKDGTNSGYTVSNWWIRAATVLVIIGGFFIVVSFSFVGLLTVLSISLIFLAIVFYLIGRHKVRLGNLKIKAQDEEKRKNDLINAENQEKIIKEYSSKKEVEPKYAITELENDDDDDE